MALRPSEEEIWSDIKAWDGGSTAQRLRILRHVHLFMKNRPNRTDGHNLEFFFYEAGSLFLARISAWLQITLSSCDVPLTPIFKSLSLFLEDVEAERFASEVVDGGSVIASMQVISRGDCDGKYPAADRCEALRFLQKLATLGRIWKEAICQTYAIKILCERGARIDVDMSKEPMPIDDGTTVVLCKSDDDFENVSHDLEDELQDTGVLLQHLCRGNPLYRDQMSAALLTMLCSSTATANWLGCKGLYTLLPEYPYLAPQICDKFLELVSSPSYRVKFEAVKLLMTLLCSEPKDPVFKLLGYLVVMLRVNPVVLQGGEKLPLYITEPDFAKAAAVGPLGAFRLQSNAALFLTHVLRNTPQDRISRIMELLVQEKVVDGFLECLSNSANPDSQLWAARGLRVMVVDCPEFQETLKSMGLPEKVLNLLLNEESPELTAQALQDRGLADQLYCCLPQVELPTSNSSMEFQQRRMTLASTLSMDDVVSSFNPDVE